METQNILDVLKQEFIARCQRNESYSLRAYARFLHVDHSLLAKILKGQKDLSKKMSFQVGEKLNLSSSEIQKMLELKSKKFSSEQLKEDVFIAISDWYHFAILELIKTDHFSYNPKKISKRLGVSLMEIEQAFERLVRLQFIEISKDHRVILKKVNNNWFNHKDTNQARRLLQKNLLKKAMESIDKTPFDYRANSSLTIAINNNDLPKFKNHIQKFINSTGAITDKITTKKREVYQLCVAFFPLTHEEDL
jgi:uncharacterized protein (TIGR02147 family)